MNFIITPQDEKNLGELSTLVRELNFKGHNPATSGNYSHRSTNNLDQAFISESGIDKSQFDATHFIPLNIHTKERPDFFSYRKTSDETDLHLAIYRGTNANCVLHSHMLEALLFSNLYVNQNEIAITGLELIKAFKGMTTHEETLIIPVFENTQDIESLGKVVEEVISKMIKSYGVLLRGHGIYVWGESLKDAKRHLEAFEYLFKYYLAKKTLE
jgi:methylthioribulose-1-phosphate dehydratase